LDAHAQNQIFETLDKISRSPSGERNKSVIFITHRLSTARRADKVAMMENGVSGRFPKDDETDVVADDFRIRDSRRAVAKERVVCVVVSRLDLD